MHRAGRAAAAANNRHGGRPRKVDDAAAARAKELKGKKNQRLRHRQDTRRLPRHGLPMARRNNPDPGKYREVRACGPKRSRPCVGTTSALPHR
jgi:hypothetical protein